ncbi:hypothetical protein RFI_19077 [Reticulomyxa filosa]|uniref:Uncharacterized protein n=1 Tax=Reticulomyxa filosa TaxID=46433 RepID=X6MXJ0_RETFI|nr:hypothetical protein RFI_19077 [Reticulomyxa filosa]|eukprot:ETO18202.1 hypothetical protein RFI_19077 [Reticulomyxa filosa]
MKVTLVLMALHVLNTFLVLSSITNVIFNPIKDVTNRQTHSNCHNMFATLWNNYYLNNVQASKTWKCLYCAQIYTLIILSNLHIFNKRSMVLENESVRCPTSKLLINTKISKKNLCIKIPYMNMPQLTLIISATFCKLIFKSLSHSIVLADSEVEVVPRTPSNKKCVLCQQSESIMIECVICNQLFSVQRRLVYITKCSIAMAICFSTVSISNAISNMCTHNFADNSAMLSFFFLKNIKTNKQKLYRPNDSTQKNYCDDAIILLLVQME